MVYCTKCGKENEDGAKFCVDCGAYLYSRDKEKKEEDTCFGSNRFRGEECFGLPYGTTIIGIVFGIFVIILGITLLLELSVERWFGSVVVITIGILIAAGAIYRLIGRSG